MIEIHVNKLDDIFVMKRAQGVDFCKNVALVFGKAYGLRFNATSLNLLDCNRGSFTFQRLSFVNFPKRSLANFVEVPKARPRIFSPDKALKLLRS